ncbi:MAG: bifunctional diguanylate cyclase/phosphodiesterase [Lachnospiraceae bacterium]|nr:bifunctional diguanylate cyclase/phosphodiesterase [Lachnospiraceae bacterium]
MKEKRKINVNIRIIVFVALIAIFFLLLFLQTRNGRSSGGENTYISGIIMIFTILDAVCITIWWKKGYFIAMAMLGINAIMTAGVAISGKDNFALAGFVIAVVGMIIVSIVFRYIRIVDQRELELLKIADTDMLTELPNRRALVNYLEKLCDDADSEFALVFIDLDNFKLINDTIGHEWGDVLLEGTATRFRRLLRDSEFVARLGGDEFAVIIKDYTTEEALKQRVEEYAQALYEKCQLRGRDYYVTGSLGVACYPKDAKDVKQILKYADTAMFHAKKTGKVRSCFFDNIMNESMESDVKLENQMRHALNKDGFYLVYQPQFHADSKELRGFETLLRLRDIQGNMISPAVFIPVAEKTNLILDIDRFVLKTAMTECKSMVEKHPELMVSVNMSAIHIQDDSFVEDVRNALEITGFSANNLELEITETSFIERMDEVIEKIKVIRDMGICVALDDFGTGFASLSYLMNLPVNMLKIDKSFVDNVLVDDKSTSYVVAIITMGHQLGFEVIAEGVEEEKQVDVLRNRGCDLIQGYVWGKPMPFDDIQAIVNA